MRIDARSQGGRRLDLGRRAPGEENCALLLGEAVGKLWRGRDPRLEGAANLRRERAVREGGQLDHLVAAGLGLVLSTASHWHREER